MDTTTVIILAVTALAMLGGAVYMLNRSWGDFPSRIALPPEQEAPARPRSDWTAADTEEAAIHEAAPAQGAPLIVGGLMPIEHPMLRQAALRALAENNTTAQYIVQDGDKLYLALDRISDPQQRFAAERAIQILQQGGMLSILDTLKLLSRGRNER